jgi:hypothetical protein
MFRSWHIASRADCRRSDDCNIRRGRDDEIDPTVALPQTRSWCTVAGFRVCIEYSLAESMISQVR